MTTWLLQRVLKKLLAHSTFDQFSSANPVKQTFKAAFNVLNRHAETLRTQTEPNIDDLLNIVNKSVQAMNTPTAKPEL